MAEVVEVFDGVATNPCGTCDYGWYRQAPGTVCGECAKEQGSAIAWSVVVTIGLVLLLWAFLVFSRKAGGGKLRPLINAWQNLSVVLLTNKEWPPVITFVQTRILAAVNFDVVTLVSPSCIGMRTTFYSRFVVLVAGTLLLLGLPWLASFIKHTVLRSNAQE